jgi:pyruvate/2-oxoglutarate dehydrogenase complex dihydrolipoamide acyltransferase (E2) component
MAQPVSSRVVRGEEAYLYAFKSRAKRHHCIAYGTGSVDIGELGGLYRRYCREVRPVTMTAVYVKALALAIRRNPRANALLFRTLTGYRIVQFDDVDVNLPIVRNLGGKPVTFIGTIRRAAEKSLAEIQKELTDYQRGDPEQSFAIRRIRQFAKMPLWLAKAVHWRMTWDPQFYVRNVGTCGLTFVEGDWFEHMLTVAPTSLVVGIGGARREPVVRDDRIEIARILRCSLMLDNYVIGGPLAAAVGRDFKDLLESGSVIRDELEHAAGQR